MSDDDLPDDLPHRLRDRARRTASLASTLAGAGLRRLVRRSEADDLALGEALVADLDQMKGMAMKVGQILSYLDAPLPDGAQQALARLRAGSAPVATATLLRVIEESLGAPAAEIYERFDDTAIAAASIGQVHRARADGREVAVKIRYPHVQATFDADVRHLHRIARLASLAAGVDGAALVDELHARLREECDYAQEARWQDAFRVAWAGDPEVRIPWVDASRSAEAVLTTGWVDGMDFEVFRATASPAARSRAGLTLARFAWRSFFVHQALNADPHPGNYVFAPDGTVAFLDFGCVRRFEPTFVEAWRQLFRTVLDDQPDAFEAATRATGMVRTARFDFDAHRALIAYTLEPWRGGPFRFDDVYLRRMRPFTGARQPNARSTAIPPPWIWLARLHFGLHAVLTRLGAEGDFGAVLREAMDATPAPLG